MAGLAASTAAGRLEITLSDGTVLPLTLLENPKAPGDVTGMVGPPDQGSQRILVKDISLGMGYTDTLRPGTYSHGRRVWCRDGKTIMPAGLVTEVTLPATGATKTALYAAIEQDSNLYLVGGRYGYGIASGTTISGVTQDLGSGFDARSACHLLGVTYVGGTGGNLWRLAAGGVWTQSADATRPLLIGAYWTVDGVGGFRMVGTNSDNTAFLHVLLTDDPKVNADWNPASPTPIAEQTFPCRSLVNLDETVYFVCTNGVMYCDARGVKTTSLTPHWTNLYDDKNGYFSLLFNGSILLGHYLGLEQLYTRGPIRHVPRWVSPGAALGMPNETPIFGRPTAGCLHDGGVLVSFFDGTNSWVLWGKEVSDGTWTWFGSECDFPDEEVTLMHVSNLASAVGSPRLWIATKEAGGTPHLYWQSLPKWSTPLQDLEQGGPHRFAESFEFTYSALDWDDPTTRKSIDGTDLVTSRTSSDTTVALSLSVDDGDVILQTIAASPGLTTGGPSDPTTAGQRVIVRLDATGTTTEPAVVRGMAVWATLKRRQFTQKTYRAIFARGLKQANATTKDRDPSLDLQQLIILAGNTEDGDPFTMRDELGQVWTAEIVNGVSLSEDIETSGPDGKPAQVVVATFTIRYLDRVLLYDDGNGYDSGVVYPAGT